MKKAKAIKILNKEYDRVLWLRKTHAEWENDLKKRGCTVSDDYYCLHLNDVLIALLTAIDVLNQANVQPVEYAQWELNSNDYHYIKYHCSNCGAKAPIFRSCDEDTGSAVKTPYCPNCGRRMRK